MANARPEVWRPVFEFVKRPLSGAVILILLLLYLHMPGYMSNDSFAIFGYADRLDNILFYHPPLMAWLFAIGKNLTPGTQFGVLVTQTIFLVLSVLFLASSLTNRINYIRGFLWGFILFPPIFLIAGALWKSVWALSFLFVVIGFAARYLRERKLRDLGFFGVAILIAGLSRHDMVAPIGVILFWMAVATIGPWIRENKIVGGNGVANWAAIAGASGAASLAVFGVLYLSVGAINDALAARDGYPSRIAMMHDLIRISIEEDEMLLPQYILEMNEPLEAKRLRYGFSARSCNSILRIMNGQPTAARYVLRKPQTDEQAKQISDAWLMAIKAHPRAFLNSRLDVMKGLWGLDDKVLLPFYLVVARERADVQQADRTINRWIKNYGEFIAYKVKIFHEQWLYFTLATGLFFYFAFLTSGVKRGIGLLITSSGIVHFLVMSAAACSGEFRYGLLLVGTSLAGLFFAIVPATGARAQS